jgi:hypothetical protein
MQKLLRKLHHDPFRDKAFFRIIKPALSLDAWNYSAVVQKTTQL